ncbi:hypothetical protein C8Q78DRAFT_981319 [Trametes maxima]|nr:hypothetical protein C8Q78DRAFT_981319 [Trametes maxima]
MPTHASPLAGPPSTSVHIDDTFGAFLIGTFFGIMLYGITIHQVYRYFRTYSDDNRINYVLVFVLTVLETFHVIACAHACYYYLITSYAHPEALATGVWFEIYTCQGVVIMFSQSYFARRVYLIGTQFRILVLVTAILLVGELGMFDLMSLLHRRFAHPEFIHFQKLTWLISAGAAMAVVADGILTGVLVTVLRRNITGMKRMDTIVDILILYAISTGQCCDQVNFMSFIFSLLCPNKLIYTAFGIVCTKLYANSLLASLNARKYLAERASKEVLSSSLLNLRMTQALELPAPGSTYQPSPPATPRNSFRVISVSRSTALC